MTRHSRTLALIAAALLLPLGATAGDKDKARSKTTDAASIPKESRQCSMPSSPRLQKKNDDCTEAKENTRRHSADEIRSTGQSDTAEALRRLNPAVH